MEVFVLHCVQEKTEYVLNDKITKLTEFHGFPVFQVVGFDFWRVR